MMTKTLFLVAVIVLLPLAVLSWLWVQMLDYYTIPVKYDGPPHPNGDLPPFPGASAENLWWFIHISDIHVSRFRDPGRTVDFQKFCKENIDVIQPELVLVTGDLTDAKTKDFIGSRQYEIEWQSYRSAIKLAQADEKTIWIDIRGNHDAFDVPHVQHETNFYRKYSIHGPDGDQGSFIYQHKLPFGTYSFVSVYALLDPGPKRPFNFFGVLTEEELKKVQENVEKTQNSNQTILFGHYPTATVVAPQPGFSDVMGKGIAYICGHLHSLGGSLPNLKALQRSGSLELEVEDWKENRMYRVMAMDHDILSFVDVKFGQWPVILITNPKRARFQAPKYEPIHKMLHSTHIRFLLYSPFEVKSTSVSLDGIHQGAAEHVKGPLYVLPWNPEEYQTGLHYIAVTATDAGGNTQRITYRFSIDGSRPEQWLVPSVILLSDMPKGLLLMYAILFSVLVLPLPVLRWSYRKGSEVLQSNFIMRSIILLAHTDIYYYSLLCLPTYPVIGPWCIGELIGGLWGVSTMHGIYVNGAFVGEVFSYAVVLLDMLLLQLPLTIFFVVRLALLCQPTTQNGCVSSKVENYKTNSGNMSMTGTIIYFLIYLILLLPIGWSYYNLKTVWYAYGKMAFFLSPKSLWSYILLIYVFYKIHLPDKPEVIANGNHANHVS